MRICPQRYGFPGLDVGRGITPAVYTSEADNTLNTVHINTISSATQSNSSLFIVSSGENKLAIPLPDPTVQNNIAVPNDPAKLTKAQVTSLVSQRLQENLIVNTTPAIEQLLRINLSLFKSNLDLEG